MGATAVQTLQALSELQQYILHALCLQIEAQPDNPRIQRLSSQAFAVKSSEMAKNWSPKYHDFKACYRMICEHLKAKSPSQFLPSLRSIIKNKCLRVNASLTHQLHPDVIANLERVYRGEPCQSHSPKLLSAASVEPSASKSAE